MEEEAALAVTDEAAPQVEAAATEGNGQPDEAFARRAGWRPEAEWSGPENRKPARFLSAGEYVERLKTEVPVLRERLRFYDDQVVKQTKRVEDLTSTISEQGAALKELLTRSKLAEQRGYERAIAEKQAEMRAAVASADTAAYNKAEREAAALYQAQIKANAPPPPAQPQQPATPKLHPDVESWIAQNEWFTRDPVLNAAATQAHGIVTAQMPAATEAERLAETKRRVQEEFPHKFGVNTRREAPASVSTPSGERSAPKKGKSVSDLPDDARRELDRFKKLIPGFTDKEFLESYEW